VVIRLAEVAIGTLEIIVIHIDPPYAARMRIESYVTPHIVSVNASHLPKHTWREKFRKTFADFSPPQLTAYFRPVCVRNSRHSAWVASVAKRLTFNAMLYPRVYIVERFTLT